MNDKGRYFIKLIPISKFVICTTLYRLDSEWQSAE